MQCCLCTHLGFIAVICSLPPQVSLDAKYLHVWWCFHLPAKKAIVIKHPLGVLFLFLSIYKNNDLQVMRVHIG